MAASDCVWPESFLPKVVEGCYGYRLCGFVIALEAWRRGLEVTLCDGRFDRYIISDGRKSISFNRSRADLSKRSAVSSAVDKQKTRVLMEAADVPTPQGKVFAKGVKENELVEYANHLGYPVVVKPLKGSLGKGVFPI